MENSYGLCDKCSHWHKGQCPTSMQQQVGAALLTKASRIMSNLQRTGYLKGNYSVPAEVDWLIEATPRVLSNTLDAEEALNIATTDYGIRKALGLR